jgi:alpha-glucosidase
MKLLGSIPTTWDETRILDGKIGEYIVTARRKGTNWFIAALNNSVAKDIIVKFDFLDVGNFKATICKDGVNAHNYGADYELAEKSIKRNDSLEIHLAPGGGFLLKLEKIN